MACKPCKRGGGQTSRLRHRVTIQAPSGAVDGAGHQTAWVDVAPDIAAEVKPASARELMFQDQTTELITHKVRIRYREGVSGKNRLIYKGRTLNIKGHANWEERNQWLDLMCIEKAS